MSSNNGERDPVAVHWQHVHQTRAPTEVSWYQRTSTTSLALIEESGVALDAPILDVGAGASTLAGGLLERGYRDITVLDIAEAAFGPTRERLGRRGGDLRYVVADVTQWQPPRSFALWHDRAVFHFLTDENQRAAYRHTLTAALAPGASAIIATFALDGPERCSGLAVQRYSPESLAAVFASDLRPIASRRDIHRTPGGGEQPFTVVLFERISM